MSGITSTPTTLAAPATEWSPTPTAPSGGTGRLVPLLTLGFVVALGVAGAVALVVVSSGHGHGSSQDDRILEATDYLTFLMDQLGAKLPE